MGWLSSSENCQNEKSLGPDGIRKPNMLIDLQTSAESLALIYRASLKTGKFPKQWKSANVTPIHNGGDSESTNYYRPMSLTSTPCKTVERIVLHLLIKTVDDVLHHWQNGFRMDCPVKPNCASPTTADEGLTTYVAVIMDFKKLFDKVLHLLLLLKLQQIPGIDVHLINWIHDFLSDRQQSVVLNGKSSQKCGVTLGSHRDRY